MGFELRELRPGLWRWVTRHPEWEPSEAENEGWEADVGCVALATGGELLFVDPLVPGDAQERFWEFADGLAERAGRVSVLTTIAFHGRSGEELIKRYGAARDEPVGSVELIRPPGSAETLAWIPEHAALVPGDSILGAEGGGLRLCPPDWLEYLDTDIDPEAMRRTLRGALLDLPVEMVLVSHGEPVLEGGGDALAAALAAP
jgi:hypothetical protein